jgi:flagellar motor switch protein FliM
MQPRRRLLKMLETESAEQRAIFNADLVRAKGVNLTHQLAILAPFADAVVEQVAIELSEIAQVPIKVTLAASKVDKLVALAQIEPGHDLVSQTETVSCWSKAEADFERVLCEVCLGGAGDSAASLDHERPLTDFDKKLRELVDEKIAGAAARALALISEHEDITVHPRGRMLSRKTEGTKLCLCLRLLINVFDQSTEYEFRLSFAECLNLIDVEAHVNATAVSAATLVEKAPFSIDVFLKPDVLDIRQILNLVPGEVLKLNVSASTPVELRLNGADLSRGILKYDQDGGHIRVLGNSHLQNLPKHRFVSPGINDGN